MSLPPATRDPYNDTAAYSATRPQNMASEQNDPIKAAQNDSEPLHFASLSNNTKREWWRDPCLRLNVWHCLGLCAVTFMNGYDGSLMNGLQAMDQWQSFLGYPEGVTLGGISASLFVPSIVFSWVADVVAAKYGRRPAIWAGAVIVIIGAVINGAAVNLAMYAGGRAVIGVGGALCLTTAPTLLQEIAHPRYRATIAGFYTCIYYIASITSSWISFGTLHMKGNISWRLPCYLQVIGPVFIIIATIGCPESPRWLVEQGKHEEAIQVLAKHHANGQVDDALVQYQYQEIKTALSIERSYEDTSYLDFFRGKANRHRLLILFVVGVGTNWVGNGIINYYLAPTLKQVGITNSAEISAINAGMQIWNLLISSSAALLVERLGRRFLWLFSNCGMFFSYIFAMALSGSYATTLNSATGIAVIPFLFLFFGAYDVAWTPLQYAYPVEILPYNMRMKGMALFIVIQFVAVTVNTFVNPIALAAIGWKYYGVYLALLAGFILVTYLYFPETKNMTIEEISAIFDGDNQDAAVSKFQATVAEGVEDRELAAIKAGAGNSKSQHVEAV